MRSKDDTCDKCGKQLGMVSVIRYNPRGLDWHYCFECGTEEARKEGQHVRLVG